MPNWLGDVVMATSALEALHRTGKYSLHLLIRRPWDDLFRHDPRVAEVIVCNDRGSEIFSTAASIRQMRFESVVDFTPSARSAILWKLAGIPRVLRERPSVGNTSHQITRYLSVIRDLAGPNGFPPRPPTLIPPFTRGGKGGLSDAGLAEGGIDEILLFPAAAYGPAKMWSTERYRELLGQLNDCGWSIRLAGVESDREFLNELKSQIPNPKSQIQLSVGLDLPNLMRLIAGSSVVISCDSGAAHLAAALGKPVLVLFFSTDPDRTAPVGLAVRVIPAAVPCRPCMLRTCPIGYLCRDAITPSQVMTQLEDILDVPAISTGKK